MQSLECHECGTVIQPKFIQGIFWHGALFLEEIFDSDADIMPQKTAYCSGRCKTVDWTGPWAPKRCSKCNRLIRLHDPCFDLRDSDSENFVTTTDGADVCRRCAANT